MKLVLYPLGGLALATLLARFTPREALPEWLAWLLVFGAAFAVVCYTTPARRR